MLNYLHLDKKGKKATKNIITTINPSFINLVIVNLIFVIINNNYLKRKSMQKLIRHKQCIRIY